jgi:membrane fusion protein (multidrug efflux system)
VRALSLENEYERTRALLEKDLATDREFDDKKLLMDEAAAKLVVGEIRLDYTKVRAPFSGRVTLRHIDVGQYVQVNEALFDLADFDPLLVRVYMPERQVDRIEVGQRVRVFPDAKDDLSYAGRVRMIAPVVDTRSGTVKVTVELEGAPEELRIGSFVRVQITTDVHQDALVIPKLALIEDGGETYVFRAEADSVVKVRVETGYTDEEFAEVLVGLDDDQRVITVGQGGLKHGTRVRELGAETAESDADEEQSSEEEASDTDVARK